MASALELVLWDGNPYLSRDKNVITLTFEKDEDMDHVFDTIYGAIVNNPKDKLNVREVKNG